MRRTHGAMTERGPFFSLRDLCRDMDPFDEVRNEARKKEKHRTVHFGELVSGLEQNENAS